MDYILYVDLVQLVLFGNSFCFELNYYGGVNTSKLDLDYLFIYLLICLEVAIYFASLAAFDLSSSCDITPCSGSFLLDPLGILKSKDSQWEKNFQCLKMSDRSASWELPVNLPKCAYT